MPRVADYRTLRDEWFQLNTQLFHDQPDLTETFEFSMPSGFHRNSRAILHFMMLISPYSDVTFRIFLNDQFTIYWASLSGFHYGSIHELVDPGMLNQDDNVLEFNLDSGETAPNNVVYFGDVFITCQVDI